MPNRSAESSLKDVEQPPGAVRTGAGLREVRERLGWQLPEVAEGLRIRLPYLEAIERGDLAALPGPAYQTGFVRSYAQALGLDPDEILRRFRAEGSMGVVPKAELSFLAPVPDRAVPKGAIVLVGVVLVLAGYGLWYHHTAELNRMAAAVPAVPAELAPLAQPPKPPAPAAEAKPAPAPVVAPQVAAVPATPTAPAAATPVPPPVAKTAPPVVAATPPAPPAPVTAPPPGAGQIITATADTWVEVRDPTGNILFSKLLHAGDSWPVPEESGLTMTAGNAGGTEITTNGKAGAPLGAAGSVINNYTLTPPAATPPATPTAPAGAE